MTRDDIIRLAKEAGAFFDGDNSVYDMPEHCFERFAALVAAAEREKCIEVLLGNFDIDDKSAFEIAAAIRARGET